MSRVTSVDRGTDAEDSQADDGVTAVVVNRGTDAVTMQTAGQQVVSEGRTQKGPHGVRIQMGAELFAETTTSVRADIDLIKTEDGRVPLADVINIERQLANPQRLALVCYTPQGKMHIVPIVNYYQRTDLKVG